MLREYRLGRRMLLKYPVLSRAMGLMGAGVIAGAAVVLLAVLRWEEDIAPFGWWLSVTAVVMLGTGLLVSAVPARRALKINPTDALRKD